MFSVTVRSHLLIAHSLPGEVFGPAQNMHGATYVVDAEFKRPALDENNIVIDIGLAARFLSEAIAPLNYQNLDELEVFQGRLTTTEFLAHFIHTEITKRIVPGFRGSLRIDLRESHIARAGYEAAVG